MTELIATEITTQKVSDIKVLNRHRRVLGDITMLARSIEEVGLLQPVVIRPDGTLVAGARRIAAFKKLNRDKIPVYIAKNLEDEILHVSAERDENTCRKNFLPSEAVAIGRTLEERIAKDAKQRQAVAGPKEGPGKKSGGGKLPQAVQGKAREIIGAHVGMSGSTYERAKAVILAAEEKPEKFQPILEEMDRTGKVNGAFKKLKTIRAAELIESDPPPLPDGKYRVIVIDPPWDFGDEGDADQLGRARPDYPTLPIVEIKRLPVGDFADANCHIYLWITNRSLPKGFALLDAWGFRYVTCLTWCKPSIGMGNYFRGSTEQILFGVKGSQLLKRKDAGTWFQAPRGPGGHSSKPVEFYSLVESCSPGPYLEMFARAHRENWTAWGVEQEVIL